MVAKEPPKLYEKIRFLQFVRYGKIPNIGFGARLQILFNNDSISFFPSDKSYSCQVGQGVSLKSWLYKFDSYL